MHFCGSRFCFVLSVIFLLLVVYPRFLVVLPTSGCVFWHLKLVRLLLTIAWVVHNWELIKKQYKATKSHILPHAPLPLKSNVFVFLWLNFAVPPAVFPMILKFRLQPGIWANLHTNFGSYSFCHSLAATLCL